MYLWESFILALALCVDSLVVSTTTAFRSRMAWRQGVLMALIFGFCQGLFPLLGALIGDVARSFIEAVDHWVAFTLLAFVGGKMIVDGCKQTEPQSGQTSADVAAADEDKLPGGQARHKSGNAIYSYILLGIATSIDAFAVGIGLGLEHTMGDVLWTVLVIGVVTLLMSMLGVALGKRNIPVPERTASIVAGVVLIGLGVKILIEHLG